MKPRTSFFLRSVLVTGIALSAQLAHADASVDGLQAVTPPPSGLLQEGADFIPGQEIKDSSGSKVKVWTTRGPVPVSQPPEPFREDPLPAGVGVVIDPDDHHSDHNNHYGERRGTNR